MIAKIKNLTKVYDNKLTAVDNISFNIRKGEILGFVGPNGSGKTTTLKLMLGLLRPTSGSVLINGFDVQKDFEKAIVNVGDIIEVPGHYDYLSGYDNLVLSMRMYKGVTRDTIDRVVDFVGLTKRINDKVRKYSLGMKQRLAIARSILHSPKLLILDEPMNGLDPDGMREFRNMLIEISTENNTAVIISSHILSEVEAISDRVAFIKKGKLLDIVSREDTMGSIEEKYFELMGNNNEID